MMFVVPKEEARIYGNVKAELLSLLKKNLKRLKAS